MIVDGIQDKYQPIITNSGLPKQPQMFLNQKLVPIPFIVRKM